MRNYVIKQLLFLCIIILATAVFSFLALVTLEFNRLESCTSPQPGWIFFLVFCTICIVFPSYLHAVSFSELPLSVLVRESLRAPLIISMMFDILLLAICAKIPSYLGVPSILLPLIMKRLSYLFSVILIPASYLLSIKCIPSDNKENSRPRTLKPFKYAMLATFLLIYTSPFFLPARYASFFNITFPYFLGILHWLCLSSIYSHRDSPFFFLFLFLIIGNVSIIFFSASQGQMEKSLLFCPILLLQLFSLFFLLKKESRQWLFSAVHEEKDLEFDWVEDLEELHNQNKITTE